jgi:hypothetical protein
MRLASALANHCAYGQAYVEFDARRAGVSGEELDALRHGDFSMLTPADHGALVFAH